MNIRTLLTCRDIRRRNELFSLDDIFSRLAGRTTEFDVFLELVKAPIESGIGVDLRLIQRDKEVWRLGEELIELLPGQSITVFAARAFFDEPLQGAYTLECLIDGRVLGSRMLYFGGKRRNL